MLPLVLSLQEQRLLEECTDRTDLTTEARRAQALLWVAAGQSIETVSERLHVTRQTVYNWPIKSATAARQTL